MKSQLACKFIFGSVVFFSHSAGIAFETSQCDNNIHNFDVNAWVNVDKIAIEGFTVLNLGPSSNCGSSTDLAEKIASMNADVVCISEVYDANTFYEALQSSYAHFLYLDSNPLALDASDQRLMGGFLIASKYPLDAAQFSKLTTDSDNSNEGLVDFVIRNGDAQIGHIYAVNLRNDEPTEVQASAFLAIIEKMHGDFLNTDGTSPFFLCGDFSTLHACEESKFLIDNHFIPDRDYVTDTQALLLKTSTVIPRDVGLGYTLSTTHVPMDDIRSGLRAVVKRQNVTLIDKNWNESGIFLCGGSADLSIQGDSQGNASAEGSVSYSHESESGNRYSGEISGNVQRDSEGNYSGGARIDVGVNFER